MNRPSRLLARLPVPLTAIAVACCLGVVLLAGLSCLAAAFGWNAGGSALAVLSGLDSSSWLARLLAAFGGLFLVVLAGIARLGPRVPEPCGEEVVQRTDRGEVRISADTIVDYLEREAVRVPGVDTVKIRMETAAHGWTLRIEAILTNEFPLPALEERLQSVLETELKETLGVRDIEGIHLTVKRVLRDTRPLLLTSPARHERATVALVSGQSERRPGNP